MVNGQAGITASRDAVAKFEELLDGESFELTIIDEYLEAGKPAGNVA